MKITQNKNSKWLIDFTCNGRRIRRVIGYSKEEAKEFFKGNEFKEELISEDSGSSD